MRLHCTRAGSSEAGWGNTFQGSFFISQRASEEIQHDHGTAKGFGVRLCRAGGRRGAAGPAPEFLSPRARPHTDDCWAGPSWGGRGPPSVCLGWGPLSRV